MQSDPSPLVSVVMAFLNEEQFLADAIESVLRQDYPQWELLLVDDGSSDRSTVIAQQYAAQRPSHIRYCEHEGHTNRGLSASRNHGIYQARGSLIALLDADDLWLPGKLTYQVALFRRYPTVSMVAEASLYWYSWDTPAQPDMLIPVGAPADTIYQPQELLLILYPLGQAAAPCPSGLMVTKQAWLTVAGFEESFTQLYEDQAFLSKIYLHERVYISAACHNLYRQRRGSIMHGVQEKGNYHLVRRCFLEWFQSYVQQRRLLRRELKRKLAQALLPYHHPYLHYFRNATFLQIIKQILPLRRLS